MGAIAGSFTGHTMEKIVTGRRIGLWTSCRRGRYLDCSIAHELDLVTCKATGCTARSRFCEAPAHPCCRVSWLVQQYLSEGKDTVSRERSLMSQYRWEEGGASFLGIPV
jgi:hypothetical protein